MPTFSYQFYPLNEDPLSGAADVDLTTQEVENAGLKEVLQAPGAKFGTWSLFDALLAAGQPEFVFTEPLGRSREVKTALSGLFGRFVARAYAEKHLGYTYFETLVRPLPKLLTRGPTAEVQGITRGDLPDWVAWNPSEQRIAIIEAKGSHHPAGPYEALERASAQAKRAWVVGPHGPVQFKRYAIATRWGIHNQSEPHLWVDDPLVDGDSDPELLAHIGQGIERRHYASLLKGLGHIELAKAIIGLTNAPPGVIEDQRNAAIDALKSATALNARDPGAPADADDGVSVIGAYVTRGAILHPEADLSERDRTRFEELGLKPTLVGIPRERLQNSILGQGDAGSDAVYAKLAIPNVIVDRSGVVIQRSRRTAEET
ncbi:hypothetical protein J2X48_001370 [Bosea sp. BE271]|nr:hypothetical protein [Bosea robiniae]MDR6894662.1 hypothetical protein [Bosea sp. BE109]MDR7137750.1 hypothetical protein [Bosea sp. BE168]MDR7174449.1 hypothetical protein [Bosea sp. BE271]